MGILLAGAALLAVAWLVTGAITGRVRARACCAVPAEQDARIRGASGS